MNSFAAIDFETANFKRESVCSVGLVLVEEGEIVGSYYHLIQPTPNYFEDVCVSVHGLTTADTNGQPTFPEAWAEIAPLIRNKALVAHNKAFDESCLKAAFAAYEMEYPDYPFFCTLLTARRKLKDAGLTDFKLPTVAKHCGYELDKHHHALADAEACAAIALKIL